MSIPPATTPDPDLDLDDEFAYKRSPVQRLQIFLHRYPWMSSLVVLIGVILVFALVNERFLLPATVSLMLQQTVIVGTLAIAQTLIILTAGIDLSIGAIMIFGQMVMANFAVYTTASNVLPIAGTNPYIAILLGILAATGAGAINGLLIVRFSLPPFIVTLAGMFLARGAAYMLTIDSVPIVDPFYDRLQDAYYLMPGKGRLTLIGVLMLASVAVGMIVAHRTRFGASVFALGGGVQTARLMGVRVGRTTVGIYAFSGFMAGLSGIVFSVYTGSGYPLATVGTELTAIAAVVIGGTLLTGGSGFVFGTLIGVMTMGLIQTYIVFDGSLSSWWTKIVIGGLLLLFIVLQKGLLRLTTTRLASPQAGAPV